MCTVFEYMYCTMYTQYAYCKFTRTCTVHRHVKARVLCNSVYTVLLSGKKQSYQIFNHQKFRTNSEQMSLIFRLKLRTNEPRPKLLVLIKNKVCEDCSRRLGLGQGVRVYVSLAAGPSRLRDADWFSISALAQRARRGRGGPEQRSYLTPEAIVVPRGAAYCPARKRRGESVTQCRDYMQ